MKRSVCLNSFWMKCPHATVSDTEGKTVASPLSSVPGGSHLQHVFEMLSFAGCLKSFPPAAPWRSGLGVGHLEDCCLLRALKRNHRQRHLLSLLYSTGPPSFLQTEGCCWKDWKPGKSVGWTGQPPFICFRCLQSSTFLKTKMDGAVFPFDWRGRQGGIKNWSM